MVTANLGCWRWRIGNFEPICGVWLNAGKRECFAVEHLGKEASRSMHWQIYSLRSHAYLSGRHQLNFGL